MHLGHKKEGNDFQQIKKLLQGICKENLFNN